MSIALDGFKVLRRLGENAEAFMTIRADVDKAARALIVKSMKAKSAGIDAMRAVHKALGDKQFELIVEGLKDAEVKSILTRIDKHHPDLKTQSVHERRRHLFGLSSGTDDPSAPVAKAAKARAAPKSKKTAVGKPEPARLQSDVMDLFRARGKVKED